MKAEKVSSIRTIISTLLCLILLVLCFTIGLAYTIITYPLSFVFDTKKHFQRALLFVLEDIYLRFIGIKIKIRGLNNVPKTGCILLSKHSSAIETALFVCIAPNVTPVAKKELFFVPMFNFFLIYFNAISLNRSKKGLGALIDLTKKIQQRARRGSKVLIFPEGTRVAVGTESKFHLGTMKLYPEETFVPVALNTGAIFGRSLISPKVRGLLVIEFLPPVPNNMNPADARELVVRTINESSEKLVKEGLSHDL